MAHKFSTFFPQATFSIVKSLVSRSPSGVNMVGECDIFYPLQTKASDWYPKTEEPPIANGHHTTQRPTTENLFIYSDQQQQGGGANNNRPQPLRPQQPQTMQTSTIENPFINSDQGTPIAITRPPIPKPGQLNESNFIFSDTDFNVGKHPGEVYVNRIDQTRRTEQMNRYRFTNPYGNSSKYESSIVWKQVRFQYSYSIFRK